MINLVIFNGCLIFQRSYLRSNSCLNSSEAEQNKTILSSRLNRCCHFFNQSQEAIMQGWVTQISKLLWREEFKILLSLPLEVDAHVVADFQNWFQMVRITYWIPPKAELWRQNRRIWFRPVWKGLTFIDVFATDFWATFIAMLFGLTMSFCLLSKFDKREKPFRLSTSLTTLFSSFLALGIPIDLNCM